LSTRWLVWLGGLALALGGVFLVKFAIDFGLLGPRIRVAGGVVGEERVSTAGLPIAAAEDFAYFAQAVPSAYFFLGAGEPVGDTPGCHHPDFDFDDDLIETGVRMFTGLVRDRLG